MTGQAMQAQAASSSSGRFWTTRQVAVLREHYPLLGAGGCMQLLPGRPIGAVRGKAAALRLRAPKGLGNTAGLRFPRVHQLSDHLDTAIREGYAHARKKGDIKALAERLGKPAWWVQKRAAQLGLTATNRTRVDCWSASELALLETYAACDLRTIAGKLRRAGFERTPTAVAVKLKRLQLDRTDPDHWAVPDVARLLGVNPATVADWIERRGLRATSRPYGDGVRMFVSRTQLRDWLARCPRYVDLRKVDHTWFMEVAFGPRSRNK